MFFFLLLLLLSLDLDAPRLLQPGVGQLGSPAGALRTASGASQLGNYHNGSQIFSIIHQLLNL